MKTLTIATLITVLLGVGTALGQDKTGPAKAENGATHSAKVLMVSGRVSADGKTLLTDIDSEWSVSNAETLKGLEGSLVTVRCYVDSEKTTIRVLSAKRADTGSTYASKHGDSAFRR
ncbi:MAG TPA: hypothetical protein VEJ00_04470 [Candidatus Acidoferrales bacterium]|jgi:hypothetical protein|nr:hypothetical protein [Candidatus Acidoferrales bacterium]